jgi:hypothetical protein
MKAAKSRPRKIFHRSIYCGALLIPLFIIHSISLGEALPHLHSPAGSISVSSIVNHSLLFGIIASFCVMLISGFVCVARAEMEFTGGD